MSKFVKYVEFSKSLSSSTITRLYGCFILINVVSTKQSMRTGALLDPVWNTYIIIIFTPTTVSTEVKLWTEGML